VLLTILHQFNGAANVKEIREILKIMQAVSVSSPIVATAKFHQYIGVAMHLYSFGAFLHIYNNNIRKERDLLTLLTTSVVSSYRHSLHYTGYLHL
jgi:heterodisulfide reductase subunit C